MKYLKHLITILKHKHYVGIECFKRGLYWQGIVHDMSKLSPREFIPAARHYTHGESSVGVGKRINGYSHAWISHKNSNKHHWEYWVDITNGKLDPAPIPEKYIKEMACDMIGASKTYKGGEYKKYDAWDYFNTRRDEIIMEKKSKEMLEEYLIAYGG